MPGLDCDKITVLWPNDCVILSFYYILSVKISYVTTFVKEVFWLNALFRLDKITVLWPNEYIILSFYSTFSMNIKFNNFC